MDFIEWVWVLQPHIIFYELIYIYARLDAHIDFQDLGYIQLLARTHPAIVSPPLAVTLPQTLSNPPHAVSTTPVTLSIIPPPFST